MARLSKARNGQPLEVSQLKVSYSLWPAHKTKRWKLQRRLYVRDPWAVLNEAVYRAKGPTSKDRDEALSYIDQAEQYFNAGMKGGLSVKPVLLYYSMLNLAKCLIKTRNPNLDMSQARHGLSVKHRGDWAVLGDSISVKSSVKYVNIFDELMRRLEGHTPSFTGITVGEVLPQILPGHRLWTYATKKNEKFLAVDIDCYVDVRKKRTWLHVKFDRGESRHTVKSVGQLIKQSHLPGKWTQVTTGGSDDMIVLEQNKTTSYQQRPIDCIQDLFQQLRPALWYTVTSWTPHRKYYAFIDSLLGNKRLPQWSAMYILFFYLSDLTRYRPHLFERFIKIKYGPQIENALDECPRQFLYLMASEMLKRDVAPAGIVV